MQYLSWNRSCEIKEEKVMKYDFSGISNKDLIELIDNWVKDSRVRQMLKDRFIDGLTFDEISAKHNISTRHCKRLVYQFGDKILLKIK